MKAIKTFFSLAIIFVFVYLIILALFTMDVFLNQGLYSKQMHSGRTLYLEVLLYSFPLSLVISCVLTLYTTLKSQSLSAVVFLVTAFSIALAGFGGIHYFVGDVVLQEKAFDGFSYEKAFYLYQEKDNFFLFSGLQGTLLKDVIAIDTTQRIGGANFYIEGVWQEPTHTLEFLPVSKKDKSHVVKKVVSHFNLNTDNYGFTLRSFLLDVYYLSYFLIKIPFDAFALNLVGLIFLIFSIGRFASLFSQLMAVLSVLWIVRLIFFAYRFFSFDVVSIVFDMVYIVTDFEFFSKEFLLYLPFAFSMLASLSFMGIWRLILSRK